MRRIASSFSVLFVAPAFALVPLIIAPSLGCGRPSSPGPASSQEVSACALPSATVASRADDQSLSGAPLAVCSSEPLTGWFRDGKCSTGADDTGVHVVCAKLTDQFLSFTQSKGNDLVTPRGHFPGLRAGQNWCLCASRWDEAERAGVAPPVVVEATHASAARVVAAEKLRSHALRP